MSPVQSESGGVDTAVDVVGTASVPIILPAEVKDITGAVVPTADIARATSLIGLTINRDLFDQAWMARRSRQDFSLLRQAVAWQASPDAVQDSAGSSTSTTVTTTTGGGGGGSGDIDIPDSVKSVSIGDVSVTMRDLASSTFTTDVGRLNPLCTLATLAVSRLSWRRRNTLRASPMVIDDWLKQSDVVPQTLTDDGRDEDWSPIR